MFSLAEGCGCVSFRSGRRARSLGDDSSSCRSSEIEQEVPKKLGKRVLNGECTMKALAPFFKLFRRDDASMTKAERKARSSKTRDDEVVQKYEELVRDEVATWDVDAPIEEEWGKVKTYLQK
ncbi:hypothetical protein NE865_02417 [Phthorimaea operculella]|nr:hypothetical protein NE865_02417 [Phthorimaea operculella]